MLNICMVIEELAKNLAIIIEINRPLYNSAWNDFEDLGRLRSSEERGDHSTELNLQKHG